MKPLVWASLLLIALAGCGGGGDAGVQPETEIVTVTPTPPAATVTATETVTSAPPGLTLDQMCAEIDEIWPTEFSAPIGEEWALWLTDLKAIQRDANPTIAMTLQPALELFLRATRRANVNGSGADPFIDSLEIATRGFRELNGLCGR